MSIASHITLACEWAVAEGEMARPGEFNEVTALEAAIECFWQYGYLDHSARALIKRLENSRPPKQAIRHFIEEIIEDSVSGRKRRGCVLINSALEVVPHDKELSACVADRFAEIEAFSYRSVKAAQAKGAVPRDRAAKDLSRLLPRRPPWHSGFRSV
jgi:TetR/AcrR family transcriptional regulator, transcriptional repressor for nem operon